jgi:hypothetical protein
MGLESFDASTAVPVDDPSDRVFTDIQSTADFLRSLAISIREAAYRRDDIFIRIYRGEFIEQARLLSSLIKDDLPRLDGEETAAKVKGGAR